MRLLIAGTGSGCGKTTMTGAILAHLSREKVALAPFKSGPDYIDPMFHKHITGQAASNLDLFLMGQTAVRQRLAQAEAGGNLAVIEGAMGFYDGLGATPHYSAYDLAQKTQTPVVLVASVKGKALSLGAEINGFRNFRPGALAGLLLNHCKETMYPFYKELVERECQLPCLGYLPPLTEASLSSRALGLVAAEEVKDLDNRVAQWAQAAKASIEWQSLLDLAKQAPALDLLPKEAAREKPVRLAVARDEAFCFYYDHNLDHLKDLGAKLIFFSPLRDGVLPVCDGLYLGGGYPELHAQALVDNQPLRAGIRDRALAGLPILAEGGGYLYLKESLKDEAGHSHAMTGVLKGGGQMTDRLQNFGYAKLHHPLGDLPAHSFHQATASGQDFLLASKASTGKSYPAWEIQDQVQGGLLHIHFDGCPQLAKSFIQDCRNYAEREDN